MLDLDLTTIAFEIVNFLVLTFLLYRFLFQPVMRNVRARAAEKERLTQEMNHDRQEAAKARAEWETHLAQADEKAAEIIGKAQEQAETERVTILQQTQTEVERILVEAHIDAYQARQRAVDDFHDELVETIMDIGGWVIGCTAPREVHDQLVQQLSDRIWDMGRHEIQEVDMIRLSLRDRAPIVYITTARPLSSDQQQHLLDTFTALADHIVELELQTDPALTAGLRARLGDVIIDNSIAGQLAELRGEISKALKQQLVQEAEAAENDRCLEGSQRSEPVHDRRRVTEKIVPRIACPMGTDHAASEGKL